MKRPRRKDLARWRPLLPDQEMRTLWIKERRSWVTERRWKGETIFSEELPLPRFASSLDIALCELRVVSHLAPELSKDGVFVDPFSFWTVRVACSGCGGFSWRLPLRREKVSGKRGHLESQMARLFAYRAQVYFSEKDDCPSCFEERIIHDDPDLREHSFCWYSLRYQSWQYRSSNGEDYTDYPLGLPSWASKSDIRDKANRVAGGGLFDWERE